jgi:hypothetical protein
MIRYQHCSMVSIRYLGCCSSSRPPPPAPIKGRSAAAPHKAIERFPPCRNPKHLTRPRGKSPGPAQSRFQRCCIAPNPARASSRDALVLRLSLWFPLSACSAFHQPASLMFCMELTGSAVER